MVATFMWWAIVPVPHEGLGGRLCRVPRDLRPAFPFPMRG